MIAYMEITDKERVPNISYSIIDQMATSRFGLQASATERECVTKKGVVFYLYRSLFELDIATRPTHEYRARVRSQKCVAPRVVTSSNHGSSHAHQPVRAAPRERSAFLPDTRPHPANKLYFFSARPEKNCPFSQIFVAVVVVVGDNLIHSTSSSSSQPRRALRSGFSLSSRSPASSVFPGRVRTTSLWDPRRSPRHIPTKTSHHPPTKNTERTKKKKTG